MPSGKAFDPWSLAEDFSDLLPLLRKPCGSSGFDSYPDAPVGVGDVIRVEVEGEPGLSEELRVPATGTWYFAFGKLPLTGLTVGQISDAIRERLRAYGLSDPVVRCSRRDAPRRSLIGVLGQSGLPPDADWRQVVVVRPVGNRAIFVCDLWLYLLEARVDQDLALEPDDVILFPTRLSDWALVRAALAR